MDQPTAEQVLRRLDPLVGEWTLEASGADGQRWPGGGRVTMAWHDSGAHLVQRATIDLPEAPDSISVIGCDAANGTYFQLYSDERGVSRIYEMSIDDREWRLWRTGEPFAQQFLGTFSDDGRTITGRWELDEDGTGWSTDFHLVYRKVDSSTAEPATEPGTVALDLFAGIPVSDFRRASDWYELLLGSPPAFRPHDTEAVWELAEHRYVYIDEDPELAGRARHTVFVDDLHARVAQVAARGLEPVTEETYENGVRKTTYRDPDGNEIGFGGGPDTDQEG